MSYIAEQKVIGALLMDQNSISEIYSMIEPNMFTSPFLGRVYHEFQKGYDNRYDVNLVVLEQKMRSEEYPSSEIVSEIQEILSQTLTSATIKAIAAVDGELSNIASATYSLEVAAPVFSVKGGVYQKLTGETALQFTCETEGATI